MPQLSPKIVKLSKVVGGISGIVNKFDEKAPEYYILAAILIDEGADVAIAAGLRKECRSQYLAQKVGRPLEEVKEIAETLGWKGIFRVNTDSNDNYVTSNARWIWFNTCCSS